MPMTGEEFDRCNQFLDRLEAGGDVDERFEGGLTTLHLAARDNFVVLMHLCMLAGANPRLRENGNYSVIGVAARSGSADVLLQLEDFYRHRADSRSLLEMVEENQGFFAIPFLGIVIPGTGRSFEDLIEQNFVLPEDEHNRNYFLAWRDTLNPIIEAEEMGILFPTPEGVSINDIMGLVVVDRLNILRGILEEINKDDVEEEVILEEGEMQQAQEEEQKIAIEIQEGPAPEVAGAEVDLVVGDQRFNGNSRSGG